MIKFIPQLTSVVLEEIPDRVTLAVEISHCRGNCPGCHSPFLKEDIGEELTPALIDALVRDNFGVDCFLFLGEGRDPVTLCALARHVRSLGLYAAVYSGRTEVDEVLWETFDYVKVGPYVEALGPLNKPTTNQRLYRALKEGEPAPPASDGSDPVLAIPPASSGSDPVFFVRAGRRFMDITSRFWHRGLEAGR